MKDIHRWAERPDSRAVVLSLFIGILAVCLTGSMIFAKEKLKPEQLIEHHLNSIGTAEAREGITSLQVSGSVAAIPRRGGSGHMEGPIRILSTTEPSQSLIDMNFGQPNYPFERIAFDSEDARVAQISPGARSPLGQLLDVQDRPITEGLLGGALTARWALTRFKEIKAKGSYKGLKKVDGIQLHQLDYKPKKSSDFRIRIFFEPETYRHVRTEYRLTMSADSFRIGRGNTATNERRYTLVEEYAQFETQEGITLPRDYKIRLTIEEQGTTMIDWEVKVAEIQLNPMIPAGTFQILE